MKYRRIFSSGLGEYNARGCIDGPKIKELKN